MFEVEDSSWIRKLEDMNSVHPYHNREEYFRSRRHFVFSFHDTTFECIAREFSLEILSGTVRTVIPQMLESLD